MAATVPEGKVQRKFYITKTLADALRIEAAKRNESQSAIVERALRKELDMVALTWQVIEDNGGGLHLAVFEGDQVIYYASGYEYNPGILRADLSSLRQGFHPIRDGWEMPTNVKDPQAAYDKLISYEYGWAVIADQDGVYPERMGAAGRAALGEEA